MSSDATLEPAANSLSPAQVTQDISYLVYALESGYAGRGYLPGSSFEDAVTSLKKIAGPLSAEQLRDAIERVFVQISDGHLGAVLVDENLSVLRSSQLRKAQVGPNFGLALGLQRLRPIVEQKWARNANALLVSIRAFPPPAHPAWGGFLEELEAKVAHADLAVIDLRGNGGGDPTMGMEVAYLFQGGSFISPVAAINWRASPEAKVIRYNRWSVEVAERRRLAKQQPEYLETIRKEELSKLHDAPVYGTKDGYQFSKQEAYRSTHVWKGALKPFRGPILILIDADCASGCEEMVLAFESGASFFLVEVAA